MGGYLQDKAIAITGGGGGIGRAIALACAAEGARVVVGDIGVSLDGQDPTSDVADKVVAEIEGLGGEAIAVAEDVTTMDGGRRIVTTAVDAWGGIDGVVCVAGILRERMLFNMTEDEFDAVINVHLKGHFTVFRAATEIMREQRRGRLIGFTSGAFQGSIAQANYAAAKGGIVSLVRSAAAGMQKYGVTANCIAPVARTRMSDNVPMDLAEMGDPEDVAPLALYLLGDASRDVTGQIYTSVGGKIAVWNQPQEIRSMHKDGRWTPQEIEQFLPGTVGAEKMPLFALVEAWAAKQRAAKEAAAAAGDA